MTPRDRFEELMGDWVEDALDGAALAEFERLLDAHPEWREEARQERELVRLIRSLPRVAAPPELMMRVREAHAEQATPIVDVSPAPRRRANRLLLGSVAAALALAIVGVATLRDQRDAFHQLQKGEGSSRTTAVYTKSDGSAGVPVVQSHQVDPMMAGPVAEGEAPSSVAAFNFASEAPADAAPGLHRIAPGQPAVPSESYAATPSGPVPAAPAADAIGSAAGAAVAPYGRKRELEPASATPEILGQGLADILMFSDHAVASTPELALYYAAVEQLDEVDADGEVPVPPLQEAKEARKEMAAAAAPESLAETARSLASAESQESAPARAAASTFGAPASQVGNGAIPVQDYEAFVRWIEERGGRFLFYTSERDTARGNPRGEAPSAADAAAALLSGQETPTPTPRTDYHPRPDGYGYLVFHFSSDRAAAYALSRLRTVDSPTTGTLRRLSETELVPQPSGSRLVLLYRLED